LARGAVVDLPNGNREPAPGWTGLDQAVLSAIDDPETAPVDGGNVEPALDGGRLNVDMKSCPERKLW